MHHDLFVLYAVSFFLSFFQALREALEQTQQELSRMNEEAVLDRRRLAAQARPAATAYRDHRMLLS